MLGLKITIEGRSHSDLREALNEIRNRLENDMTSGFDRTESTEFDFVITGTEEASERLQTVIGFDDQRQRWTLSCPEHGALHATPKTAEGHDELVRTAVEHEQSEHGGDGVVPEEMLINRFGR